MPPLLHDPVPLPWLLADLVTLVVTLLVVLHVVRTTRHPVSALLECFAFVFLYASAFENFAVVNGWYRYGRSLLMVGSVPLAVPLEELDVLLVALWLLERMELPGWAKPVVAGFFGMLQDFSLDPVAVRQLFTVHGTTSGRWSWLLPPGAVNIYGIPVYNFPGWMLITAFAATFLLLGRWWFRRSGYRPVVGYLYPFAAILLALAALLSPLSQLLLWLAPLYVKGSRGEWIMLGVWLLLPVVLLALFWRGRMAGGMRLRGSMAMLGAPLILHVTDLLFALAGGYRGVLWLVALAGAAHLALLSLIFFRGRRVGVAAAGPVWSGTA